MIVVAYVI